MKPLDSFSPSLKPDSMFLPEEAKAPEVAIDRSKELKQALDEIEDIKSCFIGRPTGLGRDFWIVHQSHYFIKRKWDVNRDANTTKYAIIFEDEFARTKIEISSTEADVLIAWHQDKLKFVGSVPMLERLERAFYYFLEHPDTFKLMLDNKAKESGRSDDAKDFKNTSNKKTNFNGNKGSKKLLEYLDHLFNESLSGGCYYGVIIDRKSSPEAPSFYICFRKLSSWDCCKVKVNFDIAQSLIAINADFQPQNNNNNDTIEQASLLSVPPNDPEIEQASPLLVPSNDLKEDQDPTVGWNLGAFLILSTLISIWSVFNGVSILARWDQVIDGIANTHLPIATSNLAAGFMIAPTTLFLLAVMGSYINDFRQSKSFGKTLAIFFQPFKALTEKVFVCGNNPFSCTK